MSERYQIVVQEGCGCPDLWAVLDTWSNFSWAGLHLSKDKAEAVAKQLNHLHDKVGQDDE